MMKWRMVKGRVDGVRIGATKFDYIRMAIVPEWHHGKRTGYVVMKEVNTVSTLKQARKLAKEIEATL